MYGLRQEEIEEATDERGVIAPSVANKIRKMRAAEQYERYDSIVIGAGAEDVTRGWFNTWQAFANASRIAWFGARDTNVGPSYSNIITERADWAQDIHQTHVEFISPPGLAELETDANDAGSVPLLFSHELPNYMGMRVILADSDEIANAPASHFPAGFGVAGTQVAAAAAPTVVAGANGEVHVSNSWKWPSPVMLAAKSRIAFQATIDEPIRAMLRAIAGPGAKLVPDGAGGVVTYPNWYRIRVTLRGPRYLQLRGARSSA
jgi:hypothetical protein